MAREHRGATWLEWMVIAAIVGLVGAVFLAPVVAGPKEESKGVSCTGQLVQMAIAMQVYLADSNDVFPPAGDPRFALRPYLKHWDIWLCPDTGDPYAFNLRLRGISAGRVRQPERTIMFYEGRNEQLTKAANHGPNVAFVDGHARAIARQSAFQFAP